MPQKKPEKILRQYFNYSSFVWKQNHIIRHVLAKKHALVIAPTGMGKSLCYQIPAIINDCLTVVISPLIALMKDQVDSLQKRDIHATFINSSLDRKERGKRYAALENGDYRILYVTPERFRKADFVKIISRRKVELMAVDEAHCISEWGHDFRPDYSMLGNIRRVLGNPTIIALTATATQTVQKDIIQTLGLQPHQIKIFHGGIDRPNLQLQVKKVFGDDEKLNQILHIIDKYKGNGILYFTLIKKLTTFSELLTSRRIPHLCYHGDLDATQRAYVQEKFMQGKNTIVLATKAFGMGIDKKDIRFVIHADIPGSIESYYQEIGRAGRDCLDSLCTMLYDEHDLITQMEFISWNNPDVEYYKQVYYSLREEGERITAFGINWLKEKLQTKGRHDYRFETSLNILDRYGVIECSADFSSIKVLSGLPPQLLDQNYLDDKHKSDQRKLYALVQYAKYRGDHKAFIHEYFGLPYSPVNKKQ